MKGEFRSLLRDTTPAIVPVMSDNKIAAYGLKPAAFEGMHENATYRPRQLSPK